MDGRRSSREQDRNQGDKDGGSDEVIHVEKYCATCTSVPKAKFRHLCLEVFGCKVKLGTTAKCDGVFRRLWAKLPRTKKACRCTGEGTNRSIDQSINQYKSTTGNQLANFCAHGQLHFCNMLTTCSCPLPFIFYIVVRHYCHVTGV